MMVNRTHRSFRLGRVALLAAIVLAISLAGLTSAGAEKLPKHFIIAYSGGGKLVNLSAFLSEMLTKYTPMRGSVEKTSGPTQSIQLVARGEINATAYSAPSTRPYCVKQKLVLRTLFCGAGISTSTTIGIYTKPGAGIHSIKDLAGKKVYAEKPSIVWMAPIWDELLRVNGMTKKDIKYLTFASGSEAMRDLKEGRVDAVFYVAGRDSSEMGESTGLFVIPLSPAEQKAVLDLGFGWEAVTWPAGFFGNQIDTPALAAPAPFYTAATSDEHTIYTVVKTLFDNLDEFQGSQKAAKGFTKENATAVWAFPFHPGAIKYYREVGIWTAEHDAKQEGALAEWKGILGK